MKSLINWTKHSNQMTQFMEVQEKYLRHMQSMMILEISWIAERYAELGVHPSGDAFKKLPKELKQSIPFICKSTM